MMRSKGANENIDIQKGKVENIGNYLSIFNETKHDKYISHGEVYCGRATHDLKWADNIVEQMEEEFNEYLNNNEKYIVYEIIYSNEIVGFAIIELNRETEVAILQDIMIKKHYQGGGIGTVVLGKIEKSLKIENMRIILLESGINNKYVHKFFEKNGYKEISVEYSKDLNDIV